MTTRISIIGAGDLGLTLAQYIGESDRLELVGFHDDVAVARGVAEVGQKPILGRLIDIPHGLRANTFDAVIMGIGYNHLAFRRRLFDELTLQNVPFATFVHPTCYVHPSASVGAGAILFPRCVVDAQSEIGNITLLNTGCVIAHDTRIGNGSFLGPAVTLAGFVLVGSDCFIGVGTVVKDNIRLGDGSQTGAGAVVIRDVEPGELVVGVPARPMTRRDDGPAA